MYETIISFRVGDFYNLENTCHVHGWIKLKPFVWVDDQKTLNLQLFAGECPVDVSIYQSENVIYAKVTAARQLSTPELGIAKTAIRRSTGLDADVGGLYNIAKKLGTKYELLVKMGVCRILRSPTLWEDAAKTLFTTNCSWSQTKRTCKVICSDRFSKPSPSGAFPFPKPESISRLSVEELKNSIPIGYRAKYLKTLAKKFSENPLSLSMERHFSSSEKAKEIALSLDGFGDYAASQLLVLSNYFNEIPIDSVVKTYIQNHYEVDSAKSFISKKFKKWEGFKWWGLKFDRINNSDNWIDN